MINLSMGKEFLFLLRYIYILRYTVFSSKYSNFAGTDVPEILPFFLTIYVEQGLFYCIFEYVFRTDGQSVVRIVVSLFRAINVCF